MKTVLYAIQVNHTKHDFEVIGKEKGNRVKNIVLQPQIKFRKVQGRNKIDWKIGISFSMLYALSNGLPTDC